MSENVKEMPKAAIPPTVQAAIMPLPLLQQIGELLRQLPHREVDAVLQQLNGVQISDVTLGPPAPLQ